MTKATEDVEAVTAGDVREAEEAAAEAAKQATELEAAIASGDPDVTIEAVEAQETKSRFAALFARGQRAKADRYRAAIRSAQIRDLRDEVVAAAKSGDDLVAGFKAVEDAARAFIDLADAHDSRLREWVERVETLQIAEGHAEQGVGLNGIGQLMVNGVTFDVVHGALRFGGIFHNTQSGYASPLPLRDKTDSTLLATYATLDQIGKGL